jgi:hypothetical protein
MQILDHHQHRLLTGEVLELVQQRREQLLAPALRGQVECGRATWQRQQVGDQRDLILVVSARHDQVGELAKPLLRPVVV